jgi:hypothetical protein
MRVPSVHYWTRLQSVISILRLALNILRFPFPFLEACQSDLKVDKLPGNLRHFPVIQSLLHVSILLYHMHLSTLNPRHPSCRSTFKYQGKRLPSDGIGSFALHNRVLPESSQEQIVLHIPQPGAQMNLGILLPRLLVSNLLPHGSAMASIPSRQLFGLLSATRTFMKNIEIELK